MHVGHTLILFMHAEPQRVTVCELVCIFREWVNSWVNWRWLRVPWVWPDSLGLSFSCGSVHERGEWLASSLILRYAINLAINFPSGPYSLMVSAGSNTRSLISLAQHSSLLACTSTMIFLLILSPPLSLSLSLSLNRQLHIWKQWNSELYAVAPCRSPGLMNVYSQQERI